MQAEKRHQRILELLMARGYAGIDELVATFRVTPQTIRRDLQDLADQGLLRRHHGGASVLSSIANTDYSRRHIENGEEKARIARAAAALVTPGSSLFLTPGTTTEAAAEAIAEAGAGGLRVVTNSSVAARTLGRNRSISVLLSGGTWQAHNQALAGPAAAAFAERYRCDVMMTSCGGIDSDGWLLEFHDEEVVVAKAMLANARRRILLVDHTKFTRVAACKLSPMADITTVVTDRPPPNPLARLMRDAKCEVIIAA